MKQKCLVTFSLFIYSLGLLFGQASYFPLGHDIYHEVNKLSPDQRTNIHIAARPYSRKSVFNLFKQVLSDSIPVTDAHKIQYFLKDTIGHIPDTGGKGFLNHFYKNPFHFLEYRSDDFSIVLNPILNFRTGYETETKELIYQNTRGLELYGDLDDKLYFYSAFFENQSNFLNYIVPYIDTYKAIRGQGNYKDFSSNLFSDLDGYDYSNVQAYLGYKLSKHSILELGHGKHFYGNGIRSLLLSDSGQNYFYLKFRVQVWKMFYQSIFSELSTVSARYATGSDVLSKKYMASHFLGFKLSPELEIALFEAVVFSRADHFEFQYLNPVVFYRTIEHMIDSPDNVLLGFNISWSPAHSLSLYGQWIL
ncbi:MAG: hypothetical protein KJO29_05980, partial [Bacteroidia bacterium]|nr:hypothetical protein [Bacteroidia bacterium]